MDFCSGNAKDIAHQTRVRENERFELDLIRYDLIHSHSVCLVEVNLFKLK